MLEAILLLTSCLAAAIALAVAIAFDPARHKGTWRGGRRVTVAQLATRYEEALVGLSRISVVLPRIEDPAEDPALMRAVKRNLARRVQYIFLVSKDRFELERDGYYKVFWMYGKDALGLSDASDTESVRREVDKLVRIVPLTKNWDRHPYIFYHCVVGNDRYAVAFRGLQRNQGIAKTYVTVATEEAAVLYEAVQALVDPSYAQLVRQDLEATTFAEFEAAPARPPHERIRLVQ